MCGLQLWHPVFLGWGWGAGGGGGFSRSTATELHALQTKSFLGSLWSLALPAALLSIFVSLTRFAVGGPFLKLSPISVCPGRALSFCHGAPQDVSTETARLIMEEIHDRKVSGLGCTISEHIRISGLPVC